MKTIQLVGIAFVMLGFTFQDHVHFLVQSVPTYSVTKIVTMIKSITAREIFRRCPQVKKRLWGGEFWSDGGHIDTVSEYGGLDRIKKYVTEQGHNVNQLKLTEF